MTNPLPDLLGAAMLDELEKDGSNLSHPLEDKDSRGYTACFHLNRELTETLYSLIPMVCSAGAGAGEQRYVQRGGGTPVEIFDGEQEYVTLTIPQPQAVIKE
jgi:hypothetical protein